MLYSAKQGFNFEAPTQALRDAWVLGITKKQEEAKDFSNELRQSPAFLANLSTIAEGTAFQHHQSSEAAHEVLSDEDPLPAKDGETTEATSPGKSKNRGSVILSGIRDKLPIDGKSNSRKSTDVYENPSSKTDCSQHTDGHLESSPPKNKRKSILAAFIGRRSTYDSKKEENSQSKDAVAPSEA